MKKIMILLSMVTICMSCAKEMNPAGNEGQTPSASGAREFIATMENVGTKTTLDADLNVKWVKGDEISVFDEEGTNFRFTATASGTSVTFTQVSEGEMVGDVFYAMYPYREDNSLDVTTGVISTKMSTAGYTASPGDFSKSWHNIMTAKTTTNELKFKNLAALVKLTVPEGLDLKSFYFSATNCIASSVSVAVDESGIPSVSTRSTESYGSTISNKDGEPLAAGTYYMPILPGTYGNFRLALTWASGSVSDAFSLDQFKADRNKVVNIGTLYDNREYYKWITFENGNLHSSIGNQQWDTTFDVIENPYLREDNNSTKVLKIDASARTSNTHGGFTVDISSLSSTVRNRIDAVKFQIFITSENSQKYCPHLELNDGSKIQPQSINGMGPAGDSWTKDEFKAAMTSSDNWITMEFPYDDTKMSLIRIRPMQFSTGTNVDSSTGNHIIFLDNIGFSFVGE